jgi:Tol biopolymer transport system component
MIRPYLRVASLVFITWMTCCSPTHREDYKIAFTASQIKQPGIFVMKSDATEKKPLIPDPNDPSAQLITASWSPDGNKIAFLSNRPSDSDILNKYPMPYHNPLYEIDIASGKEKRLLNFPVNSFHWSPDSKQMLFISAYEDPGRVKYAVYILNPQTGEQRRVTDFGKSCSATWSPDGTQLAFNLGDEQISDVYTISSDGQSKRCLTDSKSLNSGPAWSPDGKTIAYVTMNPPGSKKTDAGIYVVNPDGANKKMISNIMAYGVLWSPDGKSLLAQRDGGASLMDAEGKKTKNIASEVGDPRDVVFTPDMKKIMFRSNHEGAWHIYSMDLNGERLRRLLEFSTPSFCLSPMSAK